MNNKIFKIFLFFLVFVSICLEAQNSAIKIYVADAETGKNISNAKVCLEGFEIPAIKAQYNKKEKYYYFTEIPKNYNTVMVYHKKYNEKGFQDINGLPKELKFKLHEPLQNYYDFDYETSAEQPNKKFYNYYVEDPYKIVIRPKKEMSYNDFRNYIYNYIKENNIEIEPVNPVWERYKLENNINENLEPYPSLHSEYLNFYDKNDENKVCYFPLVSGRASYRENSNIKLQEESVNQIVFFFAKKNGDKFSRFNDKIIMSLRINDKIVVSNTIIPLEDIKHRAVENYKYLLIANTEFNKKYNPNFKSAFPFYFGFLDNKEYIKNRMTPDFEMSYPVVIFDTVTFNNESDNIYAKLYYNHSSRIEDWKIKLLYENNSISGGVGLGLLDVYEYYYKNLK